MRFTLLTPCLLLFATQICFAAPLFTATYKGKYNGWNITLERSLKEVALGQYNLVSQASNFIGQLEESSEFSINNHQLTPKLYSYNRRIFGKSNSETLRFSWATNEAFYTRANKKQDSRTLTIKPGTLDSALYQLQLQRDLALQRTELNYTFIKRKDIKLYQFKVVSSDLFTLNNSPLKAVIVERQENSNKKTRIWLLPDLNWQIARIQHKEESGDTYTIELVRYSGDKTLLDNFYRISTH
ncbi:MAG: hypothetical protein RL497_1840 [Pseudomonadota bacterium]|jgi:hypothetical protein